MIQTIIEVELTNGTKTEFPIENLDNFKRLLGNNIKSIKPKQSAVNVEPEIVSTSKKKKTK